MAAAVVLRQSVSKASVPEASLSACLSASCSLSVTLIFSMRLLLTVLTFANASHSVMSKSSVHTSSLI